MSRVAKIKPLLVVLGWLIVIAMPLELLHLLAVVLHVVYESVAYLLEMPLVEYYGLSKHQAQMLVFYGSCLFGVLLAQYCLRRIVRYYAEIKAATLQLLQLMRTDFKLALSLLNEQPKLESLLANVLGLVLGLVFVFSA